jgi:FMN phosphatase YigB (HAD superfamily)
MYYCVSNLFISKNTSTIPNTISRWARTTVHSSVVQAVYNAWEMERHHAAERHLYPDAISTIKQIQSDHPNVIIGAVTDGSANPMLMVFSLMPLFDFTVSWEDDMGEIAQLSQMEQFQELSEVEKSDGLSWIYRLAVEKGKAMSKLTNEMANDAQDEDIEWCWVHVGDDLAYDVGGSATIGAKTVLVELSSEYGQTARSRVDGERPPWATESMVQTIAHQKMSLNAQDKVDARISKLSELPEVINELLKGE